MIKKLLFVCLLLCSHIGFSQYTNEKIKVGMVAPELNFNTPEGKSISLKELNRGRYILVDFWASWCGPCRRANPLLVEFYKDYSTKKFKGAKKGFDILSVSLDQNTDAWTKAISTDNLYWKNHVSDLKGWQSMAAEIYGVAFIPQAFLIDPKGNIIGTYMTADQAIPDVQKLVEGGKKRKKFLGIF